MSASNICHRYEIPDACSSPKCPLLEGGMEIPALDGEEECPYCCRKRGLRRSIPSKMIEFIPGENLQYLNNISKKKISEMKK
jgi:hypothetical protein